MSVSISELEVLPRADRERELQQEGGASAAQQAGGGAHAESPEQQHEIAKTLALVNARELRLRAD